MDYRLGFEGIRCFAERQDANIRPVTLLVGENSSGKSTFLALCQVASSIATRGGASFNEPPFLLGAYDQIASYMGGRAGRAKSFSIALSLAGDRKKGSIEAEFATRGGQPALQSWRQSAGDVVFELRFSSSDSRATLVVESGLGRVEIPELRPAYGAIITQGLGLELLLDLQPQLIGSVTNSSLAMFSDIIASIRSAFGPRPYAFAPIRTSPQRTYDPVSADPKPEGSHVPMLLAQLSRSSTKSEWATLRKSLDNFGLHSGLFEHIEVIRKGKKESDPFQIGVKSGGPVFNLVDVGYGVSQILPILVDILQHPSGNQLFLMQQPEVHLHPRAQAELGGFFASQASQKRRFVIETHSDYLVDRVRMEVRRKNLKPQDVSLLYFERQEHGSTIHNIELDAEGNITDPPAGYRQFFLDEERSLLGI